MKGLPLQKDEKFREWLRKEGYNDHLVFSGLVKDSAIKHLRKEYLKSLKRVV
jgi:hypothetical protein